MPQRIFIVGGSSGIGLATARRLVAADHEVVVGGRNGERLERAADAISGAATVQIDASDAGSIAAAFAEVGAIDHLVLALGSSKGAGTLADLDLEQVRLGFEEKVFPHIACAQAALGTLAERGGITFVSAVTGQAAMPGTAGIGAANAAVAALVPILAAELAPRRVNAVSPGVIDTPWWDFLDDDARRDAFEDYAKQTPVGRVGTADDVARAISFLVEDGYVTGHVLICDGGMRLGKAA